MTPTGKPGTLTETVDGKAEKVGGAGKREGKLADGSGGGSEAEPEAVSNGTAVVVKTNGLVA